MQTTAGPPLDRAGVEKPLPRRLVRRLACTASCCAGSNLKCLYCLKLIRDWPSTSTSINPSNLLENVPVVPRSADEDWGDPEATPPPPLTVMGHCSQCFELCLQRLLKTASIGTRH